MPPVPGCADNCAASGIRSARGFRPPIRRRRLRADAPNHLARNGKGGARGVLLVARPSGTASEIVPFIVRRACSLHARIRPGTFLARRLVGCLLWAVMGVTNLAHGSKISKPVEAQRLRGALRQRCAVDAVGSAGTQPLPRPALRVAQRRPASVALWLRRIGALPQQRPLPFLLPVLPAACLASCLHTSHLRPVARRGPRAAP